MILSVENMSFYFKKNQIFDQVSLTIETPGIYGLVAPNGSGKTTLLHLLVSLYKPQKGDITILGKPFGTEKTFKDVSFVQDNSVLFPYLSAYDHLKYVCDMHSIPYSEIDRIAEFLGMNTYLKNKTKSYSLGMKQRLLLGIGLIKKPKLLLLDEPLNGLDPTSTILMREALLDAEKNGTTILVSSHNLSEIDKTTNKIFFIKNKKVIFEERDITKQDLFVLFLKETDIDKTKEIMETHHINGSFQGAKLKIELDNYTSITILHMLFKENIFPLDFEKESVGSESRYRELFEGEKLNE